MEERLFEKEGECNLNGENTFTLNMLDDACGDIGQLIEEADEQKDIVIDTEHSFQERLDAYEDIIDSKIGDASMVRRRNIEREVGFRQIYLKFEGGNPTDTQKDRIAFAQCQDALRRGVDAITVATSGNYGVAMATAAGSSFRKNPIVTSYLKNLASCEYLKPEAIKESPINEPLVNWHAIDVDPALSAIHDTGGWAANATDKKMRVFSKLIGEKEELKVLLASCAGLIALIEKHMKEPMTSDRYVVVLTG